MIRDPFYRKIVERLGGILDSALFEHCACHLVRRDFPGTVPVPGGSDAGMDGAVPDGEGTAFPVVATTGQKVIENLTRNLKKYVSEGGNRRKMVLVTSRSLTPRRRKNLEARALELGFVPVQVYERSAVADFLYRDPRWCRELLGLPHDSRPAL